jgi:hypothetical protein
MAAIQFDTSWLGHHEAHLHQSLLYAEQQVAALIQTVEQPQSSKSHYNGVERQIKSLLGDIRGLIRDMELSSEEQDT